MIEATIDKQKYHNEDVNSRDRMDSDEEYGGEYNLEDEDEDEDNHEYSEDEGEDNGDPESEDDNDDEYGDDVKRPNPVRLLFDMMLNPVEGWKHIRRAKLTNDEVFRKCFLPLIGISAVSCLLKSLYHASVTLASSVIAGVKIFVALFLGNFLTLLFVKLMMPGRFKTITDSDFGKQFVMYLLSTLAIFYTLYQCLPMVGPALTFLPLWTIYLAMRGCRFFHFESEKYNLFTTLICIAVLFGPLSVYWIFDFIL